MARTESKQPISPKIKDTEQYMKDRIGTGVSYDVGFREIVVLKQQLQLYYVNGLCDSALVVEIMKKLIEINDFESNRKKLKEIVQNRLVHEQVEIVETMDEAVDQLLAGLIVIFLDGEKLAFVVDLRSYPGRNPEEPDTERVIRGSRDGYTENIVLNTALTRRRVRDARLRNEMLKVGERSRTDICISYIEDIADDGLVREVKDKVSAIDIDGLAMADKTVDEFILDSKWNLYPLVRYTERPDVAAAHLLEGHVLIMTDTSPSVIIIPTTYFHHLQHAEEYRQSPTVGTFVRWVRFIAVFLSIYLLPLWLLFVTKPELLPKMLDFIGPNKTGEIPIFLQIIVAEIGVEFLRMAAIHTPTPLTTALGLIAAVLVGQIAVDVGLFSPEVILYVAISVIGSYVTPSYELSVSNKLAKLFLLVMTALFGVVGFMIGITVNLLVLVKTRALKTPYLWPFIPFNAYAMLHIVFRIPVPFADKRPSITHPKNVYRQPRKKNS
ncbi:spore germination protein [Aciduricibacillus chroicocephali]|uniref:Spore germination protein n=1 Tax=Aciduricibacillus chroicocephali TaxID=3054939 RepID=A0ABY9KUP5_9BACI|nr:spore germination protein [Bacillaceae bacterium 44XB]